MRKRHIISVISIAAIMIGLLSMAGCGKHQEPTAEVYQNAWIEIGDTQIPFNKNGKLDYPKDFKPELGDYWEMTKLVVGENGRLKINVGDEARPRYIELLANSKGTFLLKEYINGAYRIQFQLMEGDALFNVLTPLNTEIKESFEVAFKRGNKLVSVAVTGTGFSVSMNSDSSGNAEINFYDGKALLYEGGVEKETLNAGLQMKVDNAGNMKKNALPVAEIESLPPDSPIKQYYENIVKDPDAAKAIRDGEELPRDAFPDTTPTGGQLAEREEIARLKRENDRLDQQLKNANDKLEIEKSNYDSLQKDYDDAYIKAKEEQDKNEELQERLNTLDKDIARAQNALEIVKDNPAETDYRLKQIEKLEEDKKTLSDQFAVQSDEVQIAVEKLKKAETDLLNAKNDGDAINKELMNNLTEQEAAYAKLLEQTKKEADEGNKTAEERLAKAQQDYETALDKQKQECDRQIAEKAQQLTELDKELAAAKSEINDGYTLSALYEQKAAKLEAEIDGAKQQLTQMQTERDSANRELADAKESLDMTKRELSKAVEDFAALTQINSDNTQKFDEIQALLSKLQTELAASQAAYEVALRNAQVEQAAICNELSRKIEDAIAYSSALEAELNGARDANDILEKTLRDELNAAAKEKDAILALLKKAESDLSERDIRNAALETQIAELEESLVVAQEDYKQELNYLRNVHADEIAALNDQMTEFETNGGEKDKELSSLRMRVNELEQIQSDLLAEYTAQIDTMSAYYENLITGLQEQLALGTGDADIVKQLTTANAKIAELENEKTQLSDELRREKAAFEQEMKAKDDEVNKYKQVIQELMTHIDELLQYVEDTSELSALRDQLEVANRQIAELTAENARLQNRITELQNFIDKLPPGQKP